MFFIGSKAAELFVKVLYRIKGVVIQAKQPLIEIGIQKISDVMKRRKQAKNGQEVKNNP